MRRAWCPLPLLLAMCGCAGNQQSVIHAVGPQSGRIEGLWWFFFGLLTLIFVIVIAVMSWAVARRRRLDPALLERTHIASAPTEQKLTSVVRAATIVTVVILLVLLVASVSTGKALSRLGPKEQAIAIEVTGNQWWWDVHYLNDDASKIVVTANEIHIPVGRPVMLRLTSHDVIHSFWAPNLNGKTDLIPSRINVQWIRADQPGRWRGQCAEFCGLQHAHMAFWIVADPAADFDAWMKQQLQPAADPSDATHVRGREIFLQNGCVLCHTIAGTNAAGRTGPDLTHLASRFTIAAGTLPNTRGNLAGWIVDPQNIKPGNHMATISLPPGDLEPLLDYLESLK